jgi:hypothetical protein
MGDYTGFQIKVLLRPDTPMEVINVLRCWAMQTDNLPSEISICPNLVAIIEGSRVLSMQSAYQEGYRKDQPDIEERFAKFGDYWLLNTSSGPKWGTGIPEFLEYIWPFVDQSEYGKEVANYKSEYTNNKTWVHFTASGHNERQDTHNKEDDWY